MSIESNPPRGLLITNKQGFGHQTEWTRYAGTEPKMAAHCTMHSLVPMVPGKVGYSYWLLLYRPLRLDVYTV